MVLGKRARRQRAQVEELLSIWDRTLSGWKWHLSSWEGRPEFMVQNCNSAHEGQIPSLGLRLVGRGALINRLQMHEKPGQIFENNFNLKSGRNLLGAGGMRLVQKFGV